jgi:hypothetical protein
MTGQPFPESPGWKILSRDLRLGYTRVAEEATP